MRGDDILRIVAPSRGARVVPLPFFAWAPEAAATDYLVILEGMDRQPVWQTKSATPFVSLAAERALTPGQPYRLRILAMKGEEEIASASLVFRVLPEQEARDYSEKIQYFRDFAGKQPADLMPHLQLAAVYEELQDPGSALTEYEQALKLADSEFIRQRITALRGR